MTDTADIQVAKDDSSYMYEEAEEFIHLGSVPDDPHYRPQVAQKTAGCRSISSKGAILVLAMSVAVDAGYYSALNDVAENIIPDSVGRSMKSLYGIYLIGVAIPQLFYPFAGWISDAHIGRYKVTHISMWLMFIGHCVLFFPFLFLQLINRAYYVCFVFPFAYLLINVGLAGFRTNIIQFGIDQMVDASGNQLSAFIHWYYWTTFVGSSTVSAILDCVFPENLSLVIQVGINVLFMGAALLCWYCLNKWFVKEPISINPFKTVYGVLKYSSQHKIPEYRSSLTYWDDTPPSRLDLGKSKYGGPFSTEEVENVKTFFAISLVLASLGGFVILYGRRVSVLFSRMLFAKTLQ